MKKSLIAGLVSMFLLFAADKVSAQLTHLNFLCDYVYFTSLNGCEMNMVAHNPGRRAGVTPANCPNQYNTYYINYREMPNGNIETAAWNVPIGFHNIVFNFPSSGTYQFWFTISICGEQPFECNATHRNTVTVNC
ncbi:MAG: hypothetical protein MUC59_02220 [Saprospiraceae bacterium]|nr:hypothetical protein [Saprospiraceae bacterium]